MLLDCVSLFKLLNDCHKNVQVGCDSMELDCAATDVDYVLRANYDWRWNLSNFKSCLRQKCVKGSDGKYRNRS